MIPSLRKTISFKRILREDLKDAPSWIERLLQPLNQFMENVGYTLNGNVTFKDNISCQVEEVEFTTSQSYDPGLSGGGQGDTFRTISTPLGTSPVADNPTDTLTLSSSGSTIDITGNATTDTVNLDVKDSSISETKMVLQDVTTHNVSTSMHGFAPKAPNDKNMFLRGDGAWGPPYLSNQNTADVTASGVDTYLSGSNLEIGGRLKAGTTLSWRLSVTKTAAGTAAPIFYVRFGTAGTTADAARLTWTGVAQTQAADTGQIEIVVVVRSVSTSGTVAGNMMINHHNTTTGLQNRAQEQVFSSVSGTFDTTVSNLIAGVSVNPGASAVWTFHVVQAEARGLS